VFDDSAGQGSRLLHRVAYAFGALGMLYGGLVSVSLAGGPVSSSALLPLPLPDDAHRVVEARPIPTPTPSPASSGSPQALVVTPALPRRIAPVTRDAGTPPLGATHMPPGSRTPAPWKTPKPTCPANIGFEPHLPPAGSPPAGGSGPVRTG
jgi:hypothetical protein